MFKKIVLVLLFIFMISKGFCTTVPVNKPSATAPPAYTSFEKCTKMYTGEVDKAFIVLLAAISAYNYRIIEIQSKTASVLFKTNTNKEFLANISRVDSKSVMVKLVPSDNSYSFSPLIVNGLFQYITANINK